MKKTLLLVAIIGIALGILYAFFMLFTGRSDETVRQPTGGNVSIPPRAGSRDIPQGQGNDRTILVRTATGAKISVRDFRNDLFAERIGDNNYLLRDTNSSSTAIYEILYAGNDGGVIIALRKEPLRDTRLRAEAALTRHLNVSREKLCDLSISVSVARDVSAFYAGRELGISTCPGSQPL